MEKEKGKLCFLVLQPVVVFPFGICSPNCNDVFNCHHYLNVISLSMSVYIDLTEGNPCFHSSHGFPPSPQWEHHKSYCPTLFLRQSLVETFVVTKCSLLHQIGQHPNQQHLPHQFRGNHPNDPYTQTSTHPIKTLAPPRLPKHPN